MIKKKDLLRRIEELEKKCKKCAKTEPKECKKCENEEKTKEISVGDKVKVLGSKEEHIEEVKKMIGAICEVKSLAGTAAYSDYYEIWQPDKKDYWLFSRKEIEPVSQKRGRGRPLGSKNKDKKEGK